MENEILNKLQQAFGNMPQKFNILEEQIDVELQMEYFEFSKKHKKGFDKEVVLENSEKLFDAETDDEEKKLLLVQLASIDEVEAYRIIEKFSENPQPVVLKDWSILALQEAKMHIESSLLDETQVFISTGLGGKGTKLRYFIVFRTNNKEHFTDVQKKIIKNEIEFSLKDQNAELEKLSFEEDIATIMAVIPLNVTIQQLFKKVLNDCNQFGDFLTSDFIITNMKEFSIEEIRDFITQQDKASEEDGEDSDDAV